MSPHELRTTGVSTDPVRLTFGSLFAGIGGMDLGLERAGMSCRWQVEIDPYARRVLAKHWPDVQRFEDVRDVGAHNLERVDVICGGFPCQDISQNASGWSRPGVANGSRSGLWREYARIVAEVRPRFVIVENVEAIRYPGRGLRVDRLRGLGNAVVPQVAEYIGRLIVAHAEANGMAA